MVTNESMGRPIAEDRKEQYGIVPIEEEDATEVETDLKGVLEETDGVQPGAETARSASAISFAFCIAIFLAGVVFGWGGRSAWGSTFPSPSLSTSTLSSSHDFATTPRGSAVLKSLSSTLSSEGPLSALRKTSDLMETDMELLGSCHPIVHSLGRTAYSTLGFYRSLEGMLGTDDATLLRLCNAAFLHGVIELHLGSRGTKDEMMEEVRKIEVDVCQKMRNVHMGPWECRHGVGHGIIQYVRNEADQSALAEAVAACRDPDPSLTSLFWNSCENGLWMDYFASARMSLTGGTFDFDTAAPSLRVCNSLPGSDCVIYAATEYLLRRPGDYNGAIQWCVTAQSKSIASSTIENCVKGVGSQAAKENLGDFLPAETACLSAPTKNMRYSCMSLAFNYYTFSTGEISIPDSMCKNLNEFKSVCLNFPG